MIITPIKTEPVTLGKYTLTQFLDAFIPQIEEHQVVVITSKVVSICEGAVVEVQTTDKDALVESEADYYIPAQKNPYGFHITIKNNTLIASAGIDESNGNGYYILWPKDVQSSVNSIREYLCSKFQVKEIGVIITDSHVLPLRWGTVGTSIAQSGFTALNPYIGTSDIFGRKLKVTNSNIAEGLAAAAVVCMGEGAEQTPLALISDIPFTHFQDRNPTEEELSKLAISKEEDIFAPLLTAAPWVAKK